MLEILAQATQPAAESSWALVFSQLIGVGKMIVVAIVASFATYYLTIKRVRKLRVEARKEELPARVLGKLEECAILIQENMKIGLMIRYMDRVPPILMHQRPTKEDRQRVRAFEESSLDRDVPIAKSSGELIAFIEELKAMYLDDPPIMSKLEAALSAVTGFSANDFDDEWEQVNSGTPVELDESCQLKQREIVAFVSKQLREPVRAAIEAINNHAGP